MINEIREIDPTLEMRVKRDLTSILYTRFPTSNACKIETHIDLRTLRTQGTFSRIRIAQISHV